MSGRNRKIQHRSEHNAAMARNNRCDAPIYYTVHPWPLGTAGQVALQVMVAIGRNLDSIGARFRVGRRMDLSESTFEPWPRYQTIDRDGKETDDSLRERIIEAYLALPAEQRG